jgi:hypothetical protein
VSLVNQPITKSSLTPGLARLIELLQTLNFGRIEALTVRSGQPVFDPPPRVIQKFKMGADNAPRPETGHADFRLKDGVIELLEVIARMENGESLPLDGHLSPRKSKLVASLLDQRHCRGAHGLPESSLDSLEEIREQ